MSSIRAVLCGYYGQGNGGDEALLASLLQMLPKHVSPIVLSGNPQQTCRRYGVESCDRASAFPILRALRASDFFIWGGGSLLQDVTSVLSPFYYAGLIALAQQQGLKTIAWAQGIGPLKRAITRQIARQVLQGCVAISVRDRASSQLLEGWQIPHLLAPDPVWGLHSQAMETCWEIPSPRIALNLRSHPQLTPQRLHCLTQALIELQRLTQAAIALIPFQASQDLEIATAIARQLPGPHQILQREDPRELKSAFQGIDLVIGMRLHSLIMAAAEGCRCFALSYDPKVTQLMAALNLPGWELHQLPEDTDTLCQTWLETYTHSQPLSPARRESLATEADRHRHLLAQCFGTSA